SGSSRHSTPKIIPRDPAQDEPRRSYRSLHRSAYFGPSDARMVAHRDFHDANSRDGAFQDHFHRPAVCSLFEPKSTKHFCAPGPKRPEVANLHAIQKSDQAGGESVSERLVPWQRTGFAFDAGSRTERDVSPSLDDWSQQNRQLRWPVAIVSVQENDH